MILIDSYFELPISKKICENINFTQPYFDPGVPAIERGIKSRVVQGIEIVLCQDMEDETNKLQ